MGKLRLFCAIAFWCFYAFGIPPEIIFVSVPGKTHKISLRALSPENVRQILTRSDYLLQLLSQLSQLEIMVELTDVINQEFEAQERRSMGTACEPRRKFTPLDHPLLREGFPPDHPSAVFLEGSYILERCPAYRYAFHGRKERVIGPFCSEDACETFAYELMFRIRNNLKQPFVIPNDRFLGICECAAEGFQIGKNLDELTYSDILSASDQYKECILQELEYMWCIVLPQMIESSIRYPGYPEEMSLLVCDLLDYMAVRDDGTGRYARSPTKECLFFEGFIISDSRFLNEYNERTSRRSWKFLQGRRDIALSNFKSVGLELIKESARMGYRRAEEFVRERAPKKPKPLYRYKDFKFFCPCILGLKTIEDVGILGLPSLEQSSERGGG